MNQKEVLDHSDKTLPKLVQDLFFSCNYIDHKLNKKTISTLTKKLISIYLFL